MAGAAARLLLHGNMLELTLAPIALKPLLRQMMQLYLYDFTEFTDDDLPEDGLFSYPYLERYWEEPGRYPLIIRKDGQVAGFVLVRITQEPDGTEVHHIAEFFVLRKFRRQKVGQAAAWMAFDYFPGKWRVFEIPENLPAQAFWRRVINEYTRGDFCEEPDSRDGGPVQTFSNSSRP